MTFLNSKRKLAALLPQWITALAVFFFMLSSFSAEAQLKKQKHLVELGLFIGADFLPTKHDLIDPSLETHRDFDKVSAILGLRFGYLPIPYFGIELESALFPTKANDTSVLGYNVRAHAIGQYPVWRGLTPFIVAGGGMMGVSSKDDAVGNDQDWAAHWGVGLKYYIMKWVVARLDFRHVISDGLDDDPAHHFEALAGVSFILGWKDTKDSDGDGIPDKDDRCPNTPGKAPSGCPDTDGDGIVDPDDKCPEVPGVPPDGCPKDSDGDGIPDKDDRCPETPGKAPSGCPDSDGDGIVDPDDKCPKEAGVPPDGCPKDSDGDGIPDKDDRCPETPGIAPSGCPDTDGDGIVDPDDKCPKEAGDPPDGCPKDSDGDGIPDIRDKCPNKPETFNGYKDDDGCPDELPKAVIRYTGTMRGITFALGSAKIRRQSFRTLRAAASVLKRFRSLKIKVRGHTDSTGSKELNMKLSLARAKSVRDYLVKEGIDSSRVEVEGVGPNEPLASNKSRRGRAKNRRIEFKIITGREMPADKAVKDKTDKDKTDKKEDVPVE